jgi:hypothetical protein
MGLTTAISASTLSTVIDIIRTVLLCIGTIAGGAVCVLAAPALIFFATRHSVRERVAREANDSPALPDAIPVAAE